MKRSLDVKYRISRILETRKISKKKGRSLNLGDSIHQGIP